jgi:hypothetical protein
MVVENEISCRRWMHFMTELTSRNFQLCISTLSTLYGNNDTRPATILYQHYMNMT